MGKLMCILVFLVLSFNLALAQETRSAPETPSAPSTHDVGKYDFGDLSSQTLATSAWQAWDVKDYDAVYAYTNKCIELYKGKALVMGATLTDYPAKGTEFDFWALNDVATCYFIKGQALKDQGKLDEAKRAFNTVIKDFPYAQCWDPKGFFWKVAQGAKDQLNLIELKEQGKDYDFGDYTSMTLAVNAWGCLDKKDYAGVEIYTRKCIELYEEEALKQQASLTDYLPKEQAFNPWALNDVGTCYYILGEALMAQGKYQEAKEVFSKIIDKLSFSQCWDPRGWFWKPAVKARGNINKIIAEHGL